MYNHPFRTFVLEYSAQITIASVGCCPLMSAQRLFSSNIVKHGMKNVSFYNRKYATEQEPL